MQKNGKNPFMISFSRKPLEYINRYQQEEQIIDTFTEDPITDQLFVIIGVRGSGKTVLMSDIANQLVERKEWDVIRCMPTGNILHEIADGLQGVSWVKNLSVSAGLNVGVANLSLHNNSMPESDLRQIEAALRACREKKRKLLITIDEVTNTPQMRDFASAFQIWIGQGYPVFFLGTGLYEKIMDLQNEDNMTFLYRAPKIILGPLDMAAIARSYQTVLDVSPERSRELAKLTAGYSFAFQALGYTYWNAMPVEKLEQILPDYDALLADAAYSKLWIEMSRGDQSACRAIASCSSDKVKDIRESAGMDSNQFNQHRIRLKNQGLLNVQTYGRISFTLPRFREFILNNAFMYS